MSPVPDAEPQLIDPYLGQPAQPHAAQPRRQRNTLAWVVAIAGMATVALVAGGGYYALRSGTLARWRDPPGTQPSVVGTGPQPSAVAPAPQPSAVAPAPPRDDALVAPPDATETQRVGGITVVDVGTSSPSLAHVLRQQQRAADEHHQQLLMMVTGTPCDPCRGVDAALVDDRMQQALKDVRLLRVDFRAFIPELVALDIPLDGIPAFFLFDDNGRPVDGIHGGEWDADIAENIAPVLGPFVRHLYRRRRHPLSLSSGSVRL